MVAVTPSGAYELVFALAGPLGTDLDWVSKELQAQLNKGGYQDTFEVRLSTVIRSIATRMKLHHNQGDAITIVETPEDERLRTYMDAGTAIRHAASDGAAVVAAGISEIVSRRNRTSNGIPQRTGFVIRSLKHPGEVNLLRKVYGSGFFLIGVSSSREQRRQRLAELIAAGNGETASSSRFEDYQRRADVLIEKDEREEDSLGQQLRATFQLADVFISLDGDTQKPASDALKRLVELLLGSTEHTPSIDEMMMFHAYAASLRSGALGRQVGAIVATHRGELLGTGCNDVPRAEGGLYWPSDHYDQRDIRRDRDSTSERAEHNVEEILHLLRAAGWLSEKAGDVTEARTILRSSRVMNLLEFGRTTHAEMEAIVSAARNGISAHGQQLFTTTFPCHECARLIVTTGIKRVVYIEPYAKSLAVELHADSISIDTPPECPTCRRAHHIPFVPFEGIGPRRFIDVFSITTSTGKTLGRKDADGFRKKWSAAIASPRLQLLPSSYVELETSISEELGEKLKIDLHS
jgi:cytidine deaminase